MAYLVFSLNVRRNKSLHESPPSSMGFKACKERNVIADGNEVCISQPIHDNSASLRWSCSLNNNICATKIANKDFIFIDVKLQFFQYISYILF